MVYILFCQSVSAWIHHLERPEILMHIQTPPTPGQRMVDNTKITDLKLKKMGKHLFFYPSEMSDLFFLWVGPSCREPLSDLIIRCFASEQGGNQGGELKQETRAEAFAAGLIQPSTWYICTKTAGAASHIIATCCPASSSDRDRVGEGKEERRGITTHESAK